MSKHFCCCIPVRFGVFLFSLIQFLALGAVAAACWITLHWMLTDQTINGINYGQFEDKVRIAEGVVGGVFTLLALVAFFGFVGSVIRNRRMVKLYSVSTWIIFFVTLACDIWLLYLVYSGRSLYKGCDINGGDCSFHFNTWQKIVYTVGVVIHLLIMCYIASVIGRYVDQLEGERDWSHQYKLAKPTNASTYEPSYYPPQAQEAHQGLLNPPAGAYPYTDQSHSFGKQV